MASNHSPRHSPDNPQPQRTAPPPVSSPWKQVVRGESEPVQAAPSAAVAASAADSEPLIPALTASTVVAPLMAEDSSSAVESSESGGGGNNNGGGAVKRPAWNKPSSNGGPSEVRSVMGAVSWPPLSESTRATVKSEPQSKGLLDASSLPQSQGSGSKSSSSSSQTQVGDNVNANNMVPTRQRSFKHNNSSNVSSNSNGGHLQQSAPQVPIAAIGSHNHSPRGHTQRGGFVSTDHQQRNSFRNRNSGPQQRGDGAHHHNYVNRRDQDWINHRNFNGRDPPMQPRGVTRYTRPQQQPPNSAPFIYPPPVRPFGGHIGYPELPPPMVFVAAPPPPPYPDSIRGVPFVPQMPHHAMFYPGPDPQLQTKIVNQINYYFSNENLIKDTFLRQKMDDQGWVPIELIAGFKKVKHLTDNVQLISDFVRASSVVELQGDKIRRRNDWKRWIIPQSLRLPNITSTQTLGSANPDSLVEQVQNIALEINYDGGGGGADILPSTSQQKLSFGDLNSSLSGSEVTGQNGLQDSGHFFSTRK